MTEKEFVDELNNKCARAGLREHDKFETNKDETCYSWTRRIGRLLHRLEVIHPQQSNTQVRGEMDVQLVIGLCSDGDRDNYRTIDFINLADAKDKREPYRLSSMFVKYSPKQANKSYNRLLLNLDNAMAWFDGYGTCKDAADTIEKNGSNALGNPSTSQSVKEIVYLLRCCAPN